MAVQLTTGGAKRIAWRCAVLTTLAVGSACSADGLFGPTGGWRPGTTVHEITVGPLLRSYLVHEPPHLPRSTSGAPRAYPLLLLLHGSAASGESIRHASQMDSLSDADHFLVAYPNGSQGGGGLFPSDWNAGECCGAAARENIDDLGFISAVIDEIAKKLPVDARRIYVAGFSDGGRMAYHVACQLAPRIAAIGVVSGSLEDDHCAPSQTVSVIAVHGTNDDQVPYDDDALTLPASPVPSGADALPSSVQFWVATNDCGADSVQHPSLHVVETSFSDCGGANVAFYEIEGGTHGWPGEPDGAGSEPPMSELQASIAIERFLLQQVRR